MRTHPNNLSGRGREALALLGVALAAAYAGGLATKASAAPETVTRSNTPEAVGGKINPYLLEHRRKPNAQETDLSLRSIGALNNGPINYNIVDDGNLHLTAGTRIYNAPENSAYSYTIPKGLAEDWSFARLTKIKGEVWGATESYAMANYKEQTGIERLGTVWVKIKDAEKVPGYIHSVPAEATNTTSQPFIKRFRAANLPPVYMIGTDSTDGHLFIAQAHPSNLLLDNAELAVSSVVYDKYNWTSNWPGWLGAGTGMGLVEPFFIPSKKPVVYQPAKPTLMPAGNG